jgi:hypothetical protein
MAGTTEAWVWNPSQATLHLAPAVGGMLGGLLMVVGTSRALASGLWFLLGPSLEPLWHNGAVNGALGPSGSTTVRVLEAVGYKYGTGAVMVALAAFALGLLTPAPAIAAPTEKPARSSTRKRTRFSFRHPSHA